MGRLNADDPLGNTDGVNGTPVLADGFGTRFTMTLPSIVIPAAATSASVDITFTPIPSNHENDPTVTGAAAIQANGTNPQRRSYN